ncbi:sialate O-acetylesterase [Hymenobacter volaticus]|uniref:Sialate O-acetylesterase n=1 Tax=Hymenobacter volaticus TaxID=2932254 RepID=A0ABY4GDF7_9BACT|nr:sialate O-acetylesterase [Hymenobacter volaticus]UOQ68922.1 sialate O-acetylesterase [Hymenobacter volaticus]
MRLFAGISKWPVGLLSCLLLAAPAVQAEVTLNSLFSDHMVLQQQANVPIWGRARPGEAVTVSFKQQTVKTTADATGKWLVKLAKEPAGGPYTLRVTGDNNLAINDVLIGEVWLCSGQSNMERQLGPRPPQLPLVRWEQERDAANYPQIRQYTVPQKYASEKLDDANGNWQVCSPQTVVDFTAVGYFFAKNLYKDRKVPIGILNATFGGTPAEDWMSQSALAANPELAGFVSNYAARMNLGQGWHPTGEQLSGLYNGMINPLLPYALKGVAWYQGESNNGRADQYGNTLAALIGNWRQDFNQGNFPFLIVQIAPYKGTHPELRDGQLAVTRRVLNTALIVTTDCGDANDIHPTHKQPIGERLARAAQALAYGEKIEYSGPLYQSLSAKGNQLELRFSHTDRGLLAKDGLLKGFMIAGEDQRFVPATAVIQGKSILVYSDQVKHPVAVRYGWSDVPDVNLYNAAGLPASPFRTDGQ